MSRRTRIALAAAVAALGLAVAVAPASTAVTQTPAILQQKAPAEVDYIHNTDFAIPFPIASGNVTAAVTAADYGSETSGCEQSDFAGLPVGNIALVSRTPFICSFADKVLNAQAAGASGVLIANHEPGLIGAFLGDAEIAVPVLFITKDLGDSFAALSATGLRVHMQVKKVKNLG